eukprot:1141722-Pelagomonas_calceolata.AAC.6
MEATEVTGLQVDTKGDERKSIGTLKLTHNSKKSSEGSLTDQQAKELPLKALAVKCTGKLQATQETYQHALRKTQQSTLVVTVSPTKQKKAIGEAAKLMLNRQVVSHFSRPVLCPPLSSYLPLHHPR